MMYACQAVNGESNSPLVDFVFVSLFVRGCGLRDLRLIKTPCGETLKERKRFWKPRTQYRVEEVNVDLVLVNGAVECSQIP